MNITYSIVFNQKSLAEVAVAFSEPMNLSPELEFGDLFSIKFHDEMDEIKDHSRVQIIDAKPDLLHISAAVLVPFTQIVVLLNLTDRSILSASGNPLHPQAQHLFFFEMGPYLEIDGQPYLQKL